MVTCPSQSNSPFAPWNQEEEPLCFMDKDGTLYETYKEGLFVIYGDDLHDCILQHLNPTYFVYALEWQNNKLFVTYGSEKTEKTLVIEDLVNKKQLLYYFMQN